MPARLFRERFVTILVGLVLLFSNRLRKNLFFSDSVDSFTLHRIVADFSDGLPGNYTLYFTTSPLTQLRCFGVGLK